jgi:integrase/recombinase XerD
MRSFLRFLAAGGEIPIGLDRHLESPRHHCGERLARALHWEDILSLLRGIDRSTVKGCRDYAMLLLIATYGLRRSEVSSLDIDDIQWRARAIRVPRPKVGTPLVVPLTDEVATALVEYLRQRAGEASERRLFLRVRAPRGPIQATAVLNPFDFWAVRAGVNMPGLGGRRTNSTIKASGHALLLAQCDTAEGKPGFMARQPACDKTGCSALAPAHQLHRRKRLRQ